MTWARTPTVATSRSRSCWSSGTWPSRRSWASSRTHSRCCPTRLTYSPP